MIEKEPIEEIDKHEYLMGLMEAAQVHLENYNTIISIINRFHLEEGAGKRIKCYRNGNRIIHSAEDKKMGFDLNDTRT